MTFPDLRILATGGTIDKVHSWQLETLVLDGEQGSKLPEILAQARCHFPVTQVVVFKDSLEFDDADRAAIAEAVRDAPEQAVVITHGTGTMGKTARYLETCVTGKTVVLTGAMRPFSIGASDGPFNLGGAVVAAQILPEGIYGVMNGRVFPAAALNKNVEAGRFDL